jgi:hypothetical protein
VFEDLADHVALLSFDEADDLHRRAALGAPKRVGLVDALNKHGPAAAVESGRGGDRGVVLIVRVRLGVGIARFCGGLFGAKTAGLIGVMPVVADEVFAGVRDVLGQFSEEIQRLEDLEIAGHATKEIRAGGLGEGQRTLLLGAVEDLTG